MNERRLTVIRYKNHRISQQYFSIGHMLELLCPLYPLRSPFRFMSLIFMITTVSHFFLLLLTVFWTVLLQVTVLSLDFCKISMYRFLFFYPSLCVHSFFFLLSVFFYLFLLQRTFASSVPSFHVLCAIVDTDPSWYQLRSLICRLLNPPMSSPTAQSICSRQGSPTAAIMRCA